ncbi:MAG: hypothetical protein AB7O96_09290 [Pseudobdellovibrionaceae bacterium]
MDEPPKDFSFVLCPGNLPDPKYNAYYEEVYKCWNLVWSVAFAELQVTKKTYSDAFTRQDFIGATFYKGQCIGMCFYKWADGNRIDFAADSYFQIWNDEHRKALCSRGNKILVCSNLTLHPLARGQKLGFSGKDLMIGMMVQTFLHSNADAMTGAMRVDRGANGATARWGATTIAHRVPCDYGADNTELVGFFRDDLAKFPPHDLYSFSQSLWKNRMVIPRLNASHLFPENQPVVTAAELSP